jgi:cysteine-rich repeat protein
MNRIAVLGLGVMALATIATPALAASDVHAMPNRQIRPGANLPVWGNSGNGGTVGVGNSNGEAYTWTFSANANVLVTPVNPPLTGIVGNDRYVAEDVVLTLLNASTRELITATLNVGGTSDSVVIDIVAPTAILPLPNVCDNQATAQLSVEANIAVDDGLLYLYLNQNANGSWSAPTCSGTSDFVSKTGLTTQAFENSKTVPVSRPGNYGAYDPFILKGLNFLFATSAIVDISGHPGSNFNNFSPGEPGFQRGINPCGAIGTGSEDYAAPMAAAAVESSGTPLAVITVGPATGLTYQQYVAEFTDFSAYAQRDNAGQNNGQGGWEYQSNNFVNGGDDESINGWQYFALNGAEVAFGIATINPKIKDQVDTSLVNRQNAVAGPEFGRFGYRSKAGIGEPAAYAVTCAGLAGVALEELPLNKSAGTPNYPASGNPLPPANLDSFTEKRDAALAELGRHWAQNATGVSFLNGNHGNHYAMTHCCRALREVQGPNQCSHTLNNDGTFGGAVGVFNWESNIAPGTITQGYWDFLVGTQQANGRWSTGFFGGCYDDVFDTAAALLCLNRTLFGSCGDSIITPPETCDDGNNVGGDGCDSNCLLECGNGVVDTGEECDDGNVVNGDGCDSTCQLEPFCGDGTVDPGEECDDGNVVNGDGCDSTCHLECVNPQPHTQGYWHRQCLGTGEIRPGRGGRGPTEPTEPNFVSVLEPCADTKLEAEGFYGLTTCEGMDANPPSDMCEKAKKQYTALILNNCSGRLGDGCCVNVAAEGCTSTTAGGLMDELAGLILSGQCQKANDCADAVNTGAALCQP